MVMYQTILMHQFFGVSDRLADFTHLIDCPDQNLSLTKLKNTINLKSKKKT